VTTVFVVGYPRSGTCWMTWLLSDILDSPVEKSDSPLAYEDVGRKGPHRVRQLHALPMRGRRGKLVNRDRFINVSHMRGKKIVHMIRDPRDVSVSQLHFYPIPNLMDALVYMGGEGHEWSSGKPIGQIFIDTKLAVKHEWLKLGWSAYVSSWEDCTWEHSTVRYEELLRDPQGCLTELMVEFGFDVNGEQIAQAVARQAFDVKRRYIEENPHLGLYGPKIQLRNLRKGIAGDWKNHYRRCHAELAQEIFGDMILKLGYVEEEGWWKEIDSPLKV